MTSLPKKSSDEMQYDNNYWILVCERDADWGTFCLHPSRKSWAAFVEAGPIIRAVENEETQQHKKGYRSAMEEKDYGQKQKAHPGSPLNPSGGEPQ